MLKKIVSKIREENANAMVENVIILPIIFIIIFSIMITMFILHDRSTLEAAAKRGAIYAAHCISDPNYSNIVATEGNLDIGETVTSFSFSGLGKNIKAYRYLSLKGTSVEAKVQEEVKKIINKTRIQWRPLDVENIKCKQKNYIFYQDVTVEISSSYPIPKFFSAFGMPTEYVYTVTAKMAVNDPDEFIRNVDLVVDIITDVDEATGGHLKNATDKISELSAKLVDWIN